MLAKAAFFARSFADRWAVKGWGGEGGARLSFRMLTLNSDHHPLMKRLRKPESERQPVVISQALKNPEVLAGQNRRKQ